MIHYISGYGSLRNPGFSVTQPLHRQLPLARDAIMISMIMGKQEMDENPKGKKRGWRKLLGIAFSLLSLAVLTYVAVILISGRQSDFFRVFGFLSDGGSIKMADEYHFDVGRNRVFADLNGSLAAAGTLGIQILDTGGSETLRDSFRMSNPAINAQNGHAVAFDISGTAVRVLGGSEMTASIETGGPIISASINRNGWVSVCTQESGIYRGIVTIYNNTGRVAYRVKLVTGYVLSAALSPDNKSLAVLNLTDGGSRITFYDLSSEEVSRAIDLKGMLVLDMRYLASGDVLIISTEELLIAGKNNETRELYRFADKHLGGYTFDDGITTLYLLDYSVGNIGRLVTLDEAGNKLGEITTDKAIISLSSRDGYLAVLMSDGFRYLNNALEELPVSGEFKSFAGMTEVLALGGGIALVTGDYSAVVFRIEN